MDGLETLIFSLDAMLDTKRKRHMIGGMLVSASALFAGLAITVFTMKND